MYQAPKQSRSQQTEDRFLDALNELLLHEAFSRLSIEDIARCAGLTRSAFLKRFGSKKNALLRLFDRYAMAAMSAMSAMADQIGDMQDLESTCEHLSRELEMLQIQHFAANRAMQEDYLDHLQVDPRTQRIFRELVTLMAQVRARFLGPVNNADLTGPYAAAQLLVTLNYNHVLKATPGLPRTEAQRHWLIARCAAQALQLTPPQ